MDPFVCISFTKALSCCSFMKWFRFRSIWELCVYQYTSLNVSKLWCDFSLQSSATSPDPNQILRPLCDSSLCASFVPSYEINFSKSHYYGYKLRIRQPFMFGFEIMGFLLQSQKIVCCFLSFSSTRYSSNLFPRSLLLFLFFSLALFISALFLREWFTVETMQYWKHFRELLFELAFPIVFDLFFIRIPSTIGEIV